MKAKGIQTRIGIEQEVFIQPAPEKTFAQMAQEKGETIHHSSASYAFVSHMREAIDRNYHAVVEWENNRRTANWAKRKAIALTKGEPPPSAPELLTPASQHPYIERFEYTARGNHGRFEIINRPLPPDIAARCCASNIRTIYAISREAQNERNRDGGKTGPTIRAIMERSPAVERVRFDPLGEGMNWHGIWANEGGSIYSQHINTSQFAPDKAFDGKLPGDASLIEGHGNMAKLAGYLKAKDAVLQAFTDKDILVLMANPHSYSRLARGRMQDHHIDKLAKDTTRQHQAGAMSSRVEFRVPDASTDPYLSVLLDMAASYYTVNLLARLAGNFQQPFATQVILGAQRFRDVDKLNKQNINYVKFMIGCSALRHPKHTYVRDAYRDMLTSFREQSLLLPTMREVMPKTKEGEQELKEFQAGIEAMAMHNLADPPREIGHSKDYCMPR